MSAIIRTNPSSPLTMSSLEIADLLECRHDNVKRTIDTLANKGVIARPQTEDVKNAQGQTVKVYNLEKRDSYVVVAQLSPVFTAKLVDRWQELENGQGNLPDFTNPADAARAFADAHDAKVLAEEQVSKVKLLLGKAQPKIEAYNDFLDASGLANLQMGMRQIGLKPNLSLEWLRDVKKALFLQGKNGNTPKSIYVERGYFEVKSKKSPHDGKMYPQTFITAKGLAWVHSIIPDEYKIGAAA